MADFTLKATQADSSRSIIVSFHSKWDAPLRSGKVSAIFRKAGPRKFTPDWLYAYLNAPVSAIVARIPVTDYRSVSIDDALRLANEGMISEEELRDYAAPRYAKPYSSLVVYRVGAIEMAASPVTMQLLSSEYGFFASPNFIQLSESGVAILNRLAGFGESGNNSGSSKTSAKR
jgi:predicted transcriptional regulator